jgi:hypothetical protein
VGCYDTFIGKRGKSVQCKAFNDEDLRCFHIGDILPEANGKSLTVCLPDYEGSAYIVIVDGKFLKLTNKFSETVSPYLSKWGDPVSDEEAKIKVVTFPQTTLDSSNNTNGEKTHE